MKPPIIQISDVSKTYDDHKALCSINLKIYDGEFLTLLGPSGCGKTTLLRILAGFEEPDSGTVTLLGKNILNTPPEQRHINMVFQNYALFPHMTVFENVAFGLRCQKISEDEINQRVNKILELVRLSAQAKRKPDNLSGGQQQRVALARAVVNQPLVLLLDEPFSALDYSLRKNMRVELKQLQRELGITFIFVTHDQEEALSLSDRIVVFNHGKIEQVDTARQVYEEPKNLFTATFVGETNIFTTEVLSAENDTIEVNVEGVSYHLKNRHGFKKGDKIHIIVRPEDIQAWEVAEITRFDDKMPGHVEQVIYKGSTVDLIIKLDTGKVLAATEFFNEDDPTLIYNIGEKVWVEWTLGWEVILPYENHE